MQNVPIPFKDIGDAKDSEYLKVGFCAKCFKEQIFLLADDKSKALCRACGNVVTLRKDEE